MNRCIIRISEVLVFCIHFHCLAFKCPFSVCPVDLGIMAGLLLVAA